ncbi:MAG: aminotransferase class V-fold PLP-dependent enzyme [Bacteroidales bacterium]|nr:aminotransferase class V-fold PLP-dependent enzyme [Bacteroidales bacterium]
MQTLNTEFVRKQFPSLENEWIFLDNAGGTQIAKQAIDRINDFYLTTNVQVGGSYAPSALATERVNQSRKAIATFVNASDDSEIVMGSSTTLLLRILALCLCRTFKQGDEVIVTNVDHEANIGAWMELERYGIKIKVWKLNPDTFDLDLEDLEKLMTEKTRLVAVTHVSNILGSVNPIKKFAEFVHAHDALICVDAVAAAPHRLADVQDLDVDFYVFSFYKVFGPHYSAFYGKKEILHKLPGFNHFFLTQPENMPLKFQPGGVNFELAYSSLGITDYFSELSLMHGCDEKDLRKKISYAYELISTYEETLTNYLINYLNSKNKIRIIGKTKGDKSIRASIISFIVNNKNSEELTSQVDKYKIGIRFGDFYAKRLIDFLGLSEQNGVVRVSMIHYNTINEINKLIEVFEKIF